MTSAAAPASRYDARTIVTGGIQIGVATAVGVAVFSLLSRSLSGTAEGIVQSLIVIAGGVLAAYWPASIVRPHDVDTIGWTALLAYVGTVAFTVLDIALLRPLGMYHWTWDAIGGGSGFWYISIWWMGGTFLAWMGAWLYAERATSGLVALATRPAAIAVVLFAVSAAVYGPRPALAALAVAISAIGSIVIAVAGRKR